MASSATVESLELRISNKADGVASGIRDISAALKEMKLAARGGAGLSDVVDQLNAFNAAMRRAKALTQTKLSVPVSAKGLSAAIGNIKNSTSTGTTAGQTVVSGAVESGLSESVSEASEVASEHAETMRELRMEALKVAIAVKEYKLALLGVTVAEKEAESEEEDAEDTLESLQERYLELSTALKQAQLDTTKLKDAQKDAAAQISAQQKIIEASTETVGTAFEGAAKKASKFLDRLKKIIGYRVIRAVISEIGKAIKDGIDNLYEWSKLNDGAFASSMNSLATSATLAKNALAVAFAPAINALVPIVQAAVNIVVELGNAISWLCALLKGSSTYTKVNTDYMTKYAGAAKKAGSSAGSAAKEMRTILGFDEINKLNGKTGGSGGGGGGSGSAIDYNDMFEIEDVADGYDNILTRTLKKTASFFNQQKEQFTRGVQRIKEKARELWGAYTMPISAVEQTRESTKKWSDHVKTATQNATDRFIWFADTTKTKIMSWGDAIASKTSSSMGTMFTKVQGVTASMGTEFTKFVGKVKTELDSLAGTANDDMSKVDAAFNTTKANMGLFNADSEQKGKEWSKSFGVNAQAGAKAHADNIRNGLSNSSDNISIWSNATIGNMNSWASSTSSSVAGWAKSVVTSIANACQEAFNNLKSFANSTGVKTSLVGYTAKTSVATSIYNGQNGSGNLTATKKLMLYAQGGFPIPGDLFIANERGAELVGSMNNRPAVANQDQIIEGISQGVARAMLRQEALLKEQNELLRTRGDVTITTGSLVNAFDRMNRRSGTAIVPTGG